ncbi:hypothetical protein V2J09_021135 [Rumex salicifolius]
MAIERFTLPNADPMIRVAIRRSSSPTLVILISRRSIVGRGMILGSSIVASDDDEYLLDLFEAIADMVGVISITYAIGPPIGAKSYVGLGREKTMQKVKLKYASLLLDIDHAYFHGLRRHSQPSMTGMRDARVARRDERQAPHPPSGDNLIEMRLVLDAIPFERVS